MTIQCDNNPCEKEATHFFLNEKGKKFFLCPSCEEAFEWGQSRQDAEMYDLEDLDDPKCVVCGDRWPEEYRTTCACGNVLCKWCADDHHGTCCEDCFEKQQIGEAADYHYERRLVL